MLRVCSVSGVCRRDEVGAGQQLVQLDLLDAQIERPAGPKEGVEGDDPHLQPDRAVGDDRADIAAADDAQRLADSSTPMKRFFSHLPAWVEAVAAGICRASANIMAMACSAVVMELPKRRVHHDHAARGRGR